MSYRYFAYAPIGDDVKDTTCLIRYKDGAFERYGDGKWAKRYGDGKPFDYFSIFIGENDNFEEIEESLAKKIIDEGKLK